MFGLFESKIAKQIRAVTVKTIAQANELSPEVRNKIAKKVLDRILKYISEIDGVPLGAKLNNIMQNQIDEIGIERRKNVSNMEHKNPKWMEAALIESFLHMNSGKFGKKIATEATVVTYWCRMNISQTDYKKLGKKYKDKEKYKVVLY